jgi:hypothetical protein
MRMRGVTLRAIAEETNLALSGPRLTLLQPLGFLEQLGALLLQGVDAAWQCVTYARA